MIKTKRHGKYQCLQCGYQGSVYGEKEKYSVVNVCPECKIGDFVDLFKIAPYIQNESEQNDQSTIDVTELKRVLASVAESAKDLGVSLQTLKDAADALEPNRKDKLLVIELDDINNVPVVYYKGQEITQRMRVSLDWKTDDDQGIYPTYILVEHHDTGINTKTIQHNHPRGE